MPWRGTPSWRGQARIRGDVKDPDDPTTKSPQQEASRPTEMFPNAVPSSPPVYPPQPSSHSGYPNSGYPNSGYPSGPAFGGYQPSAPWASTPMHPHGGPTGWHEMPAAGQPPLSPPTAPSKHSVMVVAIIGVLALALVAAGVVVLVRKYPTNTWDAIRWPGTSGSTAPPADTDGADPFRPRLAPPNSSGSPTSGSQEWTVPINAYCEQVDLQLKAVPDPRSLGDQVSRWHRMAQIVQGMNSKLRTMPVPAEHRSDYDSMVNAWDQVPLGYEKASVAAAKGDETAYATALASSDQANAKGNKIANKLDLLSCAGAGALPDHGQQPTQSMI